MKRLVELFFVLMMVSLSGAQEIKFPPDLDRLAAKAAETVDVSLDGQMLQLASGYLSEKNSDEAEAKRLVRDVKGIYVKSFEFDKPGEYTAADVEFVRSQLRAPAWARVVRAHSREDKENVEVYFKNENGQIAGLMVIVAEPRELTFVNIMGPIKPEQLGSLSGHFGIPRTEGERHSSKAQSGAKGGKK